MKWKKDKPIIGTAEMGRDSLIRLYMRSKYSAAVRKTGGNVKWLPWTEDPGQMKKEIERCDGFLFPGGPDVSPVFCGDPEAPDRKYHRQRDAFKLPFLRLAAASGKPVLRICRGSQVVNVALGGKSP